MKAFQAAPLGPPGQALLRSPAERLDDARAWGARLPYWVEFEFRSLEHRGLTSSEPAVALRETVHALWRLLERASGERGLGLSLRSAHGLLARRELVQRGTCAVASVVRRGVASGAFRPHCVEWALRRLPFAIVAGGCVHWVFGLSSRPALRASTAVAAALEVLCPTRGAAEERLRVLNLRQPGRRAGVRARDTTGREGERHWSRRGPSRRV